MAMLRGRCYSPEGPIAMSGNGMVVEAGRRREGICRFSRQFLGAWRIGQGLKFNVFSLCWG